MSAIKTMCYRTYCHCPWHLAVCRLFCTY